MKIFSIFCLKAFRKIYSFSFWIKPSSRPESIRDPDVVAKIIYEELTKNSPCMIARLGANELAILKNFKGVSRNNNKNRYGYIQGKEPQWWWDKKHIRLLHIGAGFFPPTVDKIAQFCKLMIKDMSIVDILGS